MVVSISLRFFLLGLFLLRLFLLGGSLLYSIGSFAQTSQNLPNILLVVADDLGWRDLGYMGSEIQTPRLDELAQEAVRFERFYVQPSCSPTRASLLTGKSALRLGVTSPFSKQNPGGLDLGQKLLPQYLQELNYQTWLVGKWHLGFRKKAYLPTERGFDHFYGNLTGGIGYWDHVHGGGYDWQRNTEVIRDSGYSTHLLVEEARRLIEQRDPQRPVFLMASFNAPHIPNEAPAATVKRYAHIKDVRRRHHAAMVTELDSAVGSIIDTLLKEGMQDNTIVWFMSDNGGLNSSSFSDGLVEVFSVLDRWFAGGPLPFAQVEFIRANVIDGAASNYPLRKGKLSVYEGGTRVPSFVFWPGTLTSTDVESQVTVEDVMPTLMAATGNGHVSVDGENQWDVITGVSSDKERRFAVAASDGEAILRYPWKLIRLNNGSIELFNLKNDPQEKANIAESHRQLVLELGAELDDWPRAESQNIPFVRALMDPDSFGGKETRQPWIEQVEDLFPLPSK